MKKSSQPATVSSIKPVFGLLSAVVLSVVLALSASSSFAEPTVYTVSASSSGEGFISPSGSLAVREGGRMSFVFNADMDHSVVDVIVDGTSLGPMDAFSFENVDGSHTIQAVFESDPPTVNVASYKNDNGSNEGAPTGGL